MGYGLAASEVSGGHHAANESSNYVRAGYTGKNVMSGEGEGREENSRW